MDTTSEIKRGDRVRRKSGGPTGTVVSIFTAWDGKSTRRARVHWDARLSGRRRLGTGSKDTHSYVAVASLVRVSPPVEVGSVASTPAMA